MHLGDQNRDVGFVEWFQIRRLGLVSNVEQNGVSLALFGHFDILLQADPLVVEIVLESVQLYDILCSMLERSLFNEYLELFVPFHVIKRVPLSLLSEMFKNPICKNCFDLGY